MNFTRKHLRAALRGAKVITGRQIARLLSMSRLRWVNGRLVVRGYSGEGYQYCAMGQIAKLAGFDERVINQGGSIVKSIYVTNDNTRSKEQCIKAFCDQGDQEHDVSKWMETLKYWEEKS
jgi:hypothetical protein